MQVAYETYGELDAERANAVFLCHALTGSAHAAAPDGWWRTLVGPGLAVDTERFFVICPNLLGGCSGTTGPSSTDPATGNAYGLDFPPLAVTDLVAVHRRLLEHLEIETLHAAIGGSLGGMQVLQWLLDAPGQIARAAIVAASSRLSAQNLAFSAATRHAILSDPAFHSGAYALYSTRPSRGLSTARRVGHITYLAEASMDARFARPAEPDPAPPADAREWLSSRYPVETYLDHQAETFLARFDALSYLWLSRVMDGFDPFAASHAADTRPRSGGPRARAQLQLRLALRRGPFAANRRGAAPARRRARRPSSRSSPRSATTRSCSRSPATRTRSRGSSRADRRGCGVPKWGGSLGNRLESAPPC